MLLAGGPARQSNTTGVMLTYWHRVEEVWELTATIYRRRRACTCLQKRTPSVAFGRPGSLSQNSSLHAAHAHAHDLALLDVQGSASGESRAARELVLPRNPEARNMCVRWGRCVVYPYRRVSGAVLVLQKREGRKKEAYNAHGWERGTSGIYMSSKKADRHWKRARDPWCERLARSIGLEGAIHAVCRGLDVRQDYLGRKGKTVILNTAMILDQMVELSDVVRQHLDLPVYQRNLSPCLQCQITQKLSRMSF